MLWLDAVDVVDVVFLVVINLAAVVSVCSYGKGISQYVVYKGKNTKTPCK